MRTHGTEHMEMNEFREAWLNAAPGQVIVYASGDVAACRQRGAELNLLAATLWNMSAAGQIHLLQRRRRERPFDMSGGASFDYLAIKATPPRAAAAFAR